MSSNLCLEVASPNPEAAELVMSWRNDKDSLANSFNSKSKVWPEFYDEFRQDYFADPILPCAFVHQDGRRIAFVRFRRLPGLVNGQRACDISLNVAPAERGRGKGAEVVNLAMQIPRAAGIPIVVADVKRENIRSIKVFEKSGFEFYEDFEHHCSAGTVPCRRFIRRTFDAVAVPGATIGEGKCFVIAEAGSNWRAGSRARDLKMAKTLIEVAAEAGANAVKFQTFQPRTTYAPNAGSSDYLSEAGITEEIHDIFTDLAMPPDMLPELAEHARLANILFMSSPFSIADCRLVDPHVPIHKLASYEISHLRLIEEIAKTGKPVIVSTGASTVDDIRWAVETFRSGSQAGLCLMQCTAQYPSGLASLNLGVIPYLKSLFGVPVGLSDHSRHHLIGPVAAVALGADLIEKHFTLYNRLPGPDHAFAVTPVELKEMVESIRLAEQVVGSACKSVQPVEEELFAYARRGLQAISEIGVGERLIEGLNFDILRPGKQPRGAHPKHIESINARAATRVIRLGEGIQLEDCDS